MPLRSRYTRPVPKAHNRLMAVRTLPAPDPHSKTYASIAGQALGSVHLEEEFEPPEVPALEDLHAALAESTGFFGALGDLVNNPDDD